MPHLPGQLSTNARQPPTLPLRPPPPRNQPSVLQPTLLRTSRRSETKMVSTPRTCGRVSTLRTKMRLPAAKCVSRTLSAWLWTTTLTLAAPCILARSAANQFRSRTTSPVRRDFPLRQGAGPSHSQHKAVMKLAQDRLLVSKMAAMHMW